MEWKIWQIKEFYDNTLIPQMLTQPHKFLHRLKMQQYQIRQQQMVQEAQDRDLKIMQKMSESQ